MQYKKIKGKVTSERALEARKFIDKEATEKLPEYIRKVGGIVCNGRGVPKGYREIGGHFSRNAYMPDNVSFDGCTSIPIKSSRGADKTFSISLDEISKKTRGEKYFFPDSGESVVVYVCDQESAKIVDKTLEKLSLSNPDAKSNREKAREALDIFFE